MRQAPAVCLYQPMHRAVRLLAYTFWGASTSGTHVAAAESTAHYNKAMSEKYQLPPAMSGLACTAVSGRSNTGAKRQHGISGISVAFAKHNLQM